RAFLLTDEIHAPVDAVGAVDIGKARRAEHHLIPGRRPPKGMGRRIGMMIGLDLDDDPADAVHQKRRADQVGRDLVDAAGEKGALQWPAERGGGGLRFWSHSRWESSENRAGYSPYLPCSLKRREPGCDNSRYRLGRT